MIVADSCGSWRSCFLSLRASRDNIGGGFLSDESWRPYVTLISGLLENEIVASWWQSRVSPYSMEFRNYVNREWTEGAGATWRYTNLSEL